MINYDLLLPFLRFCLDENRPVPRDVVQSIDWQQLFDFAQEQALLGVCMEGIKRLDRNTVNRPPINVLATWVTVANKIEQRNRYMFRMSVRVSDQFADFGFVPCVLKGQANAMMYPNPGMRSSGDIDLWLKSNKVQNSRHWLGENRRRVLAYVRSVVKDAVACYHHVDFPVLDACPIEVHFTPSYLSNPFYNRRLQRWYGSYDAMTHVSHAWQEKDKDGRLMTFPTPSLSFNRIYQLTHIQHHFFDEGIGLRQLIDYFYLLRQGFTEEERLHDVGLLRQFGLVPIAGAVMYVLKEVLGLEDRFLLLPADARRGKILLADMLKGGNFGVNNHIGSRGMAGKYFAKTWRNLRVAWLFPGEALWEPVFRTWLFFWKKWWL